MKAASKREVLVRSGVAAGSARQQPQPPADEDDEYGSAAASRNVAGTAAPRRLAPLAHAYDNSNADGNPDTLGHLPARPETVAPAKATSFALQTSPSVLAGVVFGLCGVLAVASVQHTLASFAEEGGVSPAVFFAVPGLFAALFAIVAYQGARRKVTTMAQSFSRALLVALLTWGSFAALATSVWCKPEHYGQCYSSFLIVSGLIGGGPMLIAAGVAGAIMGWLILRQRAAS